MVQALQFMAEVMERSQGFVRAQRTPHLSGGMGQRTREELPAGSGAVSWTHKTVLFRALMPVSW